MPDRTVIERWRRCEEDLGLDGWEQVTTRQPDPFRRVYIRDDSIAKVEVPQRMISNNRRRRNLEGEYEIYRTCVGVRGIPAVKDWRQNDGVDALFLERVAGRPLQIDESGWLSVTATTIRLAALAARLARRGVSHNDFDPSNILLDENGTISLIDFDQATISSQFVAVVRAFLGVPKHDALVMTSVFYLLRLKLNSTLKKMLPGSVFNLLRNVKKSYIRAKHSRELPVLDDAATEQQRILLRAWRIAQRSDANAPGDGLAYYEINDGICVFPGERPWNERWEVLKQTADFSNKRVLELGCNMGLLSTWLLKHSNAAYSMAIDHDAEIIDSAKLVALAMGVTVDFDVADFDSDEPWEEKLLASKADIVFALNVLNWVKDKGRLLDFLANFDYVVFEGHDSFDVEKERFASRGFNNVELVSVSERNRPLMVCKKAA